ncbi:AEC family transporter [Leptothoe kymatousa]|uniref:AEC family transporter n=1 Tax=Leptothoe kymatousa TAU-MAC 1615 TaxID=2364775 RepID=A0ABS5XZ77_9CYAN|nr:AEC family transporter [Leptothoe kymatousa]MBT9310907.1 AEC family transporter [Leptothoe kymatousa TAU-MAC 1615]
MGILISAVLPIALIALVGICLGKTFSLERQTLAKLSIYALVPALVLHSLANTTLELGNAIAILIAFLLNTALLYLIAHGLSQFLGFSSDEKKSLIATTIFANVGNMGLPFILFSLGEAGLERAIVYLVGSSLMTASVFPIVLKGDGIAKGLRYTLCLPVLWAAIAGILLQSTNTTLAVPLDRGITLLSDGAIPVALLMLGIQLSETPFVFGRYELLGAGLRLIISPLLAFNIANLVGLTALDRQVVVLQAAMPVAVNSLIWVTELGGDTVRVARTIVVSTLLSLGTLPVVLWLSSRG